MSRFGGILLLTFFLYISPGQRLFTLSFASPGSPQTLAAALIEEMSDEEALAQTFMLGWVGAEPSPLIMNWIRYRNIGGVKIFGWNTEDTQKLAETVGTLQRVSLETRLNIPLLVATDQEGGWIRHVKGATSETPGNMAIGASGYPRDAYYAGYYIGRELAVLGINMNFAPTVDLYTNRESSLIGTRAFGEDPVQAGILGAAFVKGHKAAGVIATAKHYPGHGDTDLDSHGVLPRINATMEALWERELIPYRLLAREGIPAIMSGHLAFPNTQAGLTPASLSSWFLQDILRDRIRYQGLIITDDLMMNGATTSAGSVSQAAKQALLAGNDIVMFSSTPSLNDRVWTYLADSMKEEPRFRARVRDAARRVLETKLTYLRGETAVPYIPDLRKVAASLPDPEGAAFFLDLAARSVTILSGEEILPLDPEKAGKVLLAGNYTEFFTTGKIAFPSARSYWYSLEGMAALQDYARDVDTIIFCLSDQEGLTILKNLESLKKQVIVFSVLSPVYLDKISWVAGAVAVYSYAPESFIAGFSVILGRIPAQGRLPFPREAGGTSVLR
ncbi:MAG: glycoside hydrolase family 3 protein [Spirochaetaceae bacterium]|jgi:beta-N-acetylhexosaminidase|nr:glycoside hydrolase family 3 protein [Spirochaetaceae bacterium]